MSTEQGAELIWIALASTLVISALLSRRFTLRGVLGMVIAWIGIFGVALVLFSYRYELTSVKDRVVTEVTGRSEQRAQGQSLRVRAAADGHYWVDGEVNGTPARFLIDSGATITALSEETARNAGLNIDDIGPGVLLQTANGSVQARRSSISGLTVGPVTSSDLGVVVSDRFGDVNVLGMNFLSRLKSWRVENGEMVLEP